MQTDMFEEERLEAEMFFHLKIYIPRFALPSLLNIIPLQRNSHVFPDTSRLPTCTTQSIKNSFMFIVVHKIYRLYPICVI